MRLNEHHQAISGELGRHGIRPEIEVTHGNHVRFRWKAGGHAQSFVTSNTPSDHRSTKNALANVRRLLRDAGVVVKRPATLKVDALAEALAVPAPPPPPPPTIDQRLASIEADMRTLLALVGRLLPPQPEPKPQPVAPVAAPAPKMNGNGGVHHPALRERKEPGVPLMERADFWIWRGMRFDVFRSAVDIAKEVGKTAPHVSSTLTALKRLGLVQHDRAKGWRKAAKVDRLPTAIINGKRIEH